MRFLVKVLCATLFLSLMPGCSARMNSVPLSAQNPVAFHLEHEGPLGIFDPSFAQSPDGIFWMSYSSVDFGWSDPRNGAVSTRLARSNDAVRWSVMAGALNPSVSKGASRQTVHEVSNLVFDASAPENEKWKIFWHEYEWVAGERDFRHGWISMRTSANPEGPWSSRKKLFVGWGFLSDGQDEPLTRLDLLHADLGGCLAFTEPAAIYHDGSLYLALTCAQILKSRGRIILLRESGSEWTYVGTILTNDADAAPTGYDGFSAPEFAQVGPQLHLIVTPTIGDIYAGCAIYSIEDLRTASARRLSGRATLSRFIAGPARFQGACGFRGGSSPDLYFGEAHFDELPIFHLFRFPFPDL